MSDRVLESLRALGMGDNPVLNHDLISSLGVADVAPPSLEPVSDFVAPAASLGQSDVPSTPPETPKGSRRGKEEMLAARFVRYHYAENAQPGSALVSSVAYSALTEFARYNGGEGKRKQLLSYLLSVELPAPTHLRERAVLVDATRNLSDPDEYEVPAWLKQDSLDLEKSYPVAFLIDPYTSWALEDLMSYSGFPKNAIIDALLQQSLPKAARLAVKKRRSLMPR